MPRHPSGFLRIPPAMRAAALVATLMPLTAQDRSPVEPVSLPDPEQRLEPVKPQIEKLDATRYRVGEVELDSKTREIRFPARVNMTEGLLEYLVVHTNGKVHEALFITDISATHLNLALTLLRYPASRELYPLPTPTGGLSDKFPDVPEPIRKASRVLIDVEWKDDGKLRRLPVNDWIQHTVKTSAMPAGPWVYGGSEFYDGKFVPETTGDIIAIFTAQSAMINYPGEDNRDDTVWIVYPKRVPAEGTHVTVILHPYLTSSPESAVSNPTTPKSP